MDKMPRLRSHPELMAGYPLLQSDDLDHYHSLVTETGGTHERQQLENGRFRCRVFGIRLPEGLIANVHYNRKTWIRTPGDYQVHFLHVFRRGTGSYSFEDGRITGDENRAVLIPAGVAYEADYTSLDAIVVALDSDMLAREVGHLGDGAVGRPARSGRSIDLGSRRGRVLLEILQAYVLSMDAFAPERVRDRDVAATAFHASLAGLLLPDLYGRQPAPGARALERRKEKLDQFADFVESHLHEPLDLNRLARVAGMGPRDLQRSCHGRWQLSPTRFVLERRLIRSREKLRSPAEGTLVSSVAFDCGFTHLGRFASEYRQRFGESPSKTLAAARNG